MLASTRTSARWSRSLGQGITRPRLDEHVAKAPSCAAHFVASAPTPSQVPVRDSETRRIVEDVVATEVEGDDDRKYSRRGHTQPAYSPHGSEVLAPPRRLPHRWRECAGPGERGQRSSTVTLTTAVHTTGVNKSTGCDCSLQAEQATQSRALPHASSAGQPAASMSANQLCADACLRGSNFLWGWCRP